MYTVWSLCKVCANVCAVYEAPGTLTIVCCGDWACSMVAPDDVSIKLVCEDGNRVVVDSVSIGRSQLLATLPCLPEEIPVPFSREQVAIWHAFSGENISTKSFTDCISALKVLFPLAFVKFMPHRPHLACAACCKLQRVRRTVCLSCVVPFTRVSVRCR